MEVIAPAWRALVACVLALGSLLATACEAEAQTAIKVDDPEVLIVVFDYDGLAPMVMQISFILYTDGTFAQLRHGTSTDDGDAFVQGKIAAGAALELASQAHADLGQVHSNVNGLEDMSAKGAFEVWYWNPADHLYWHPILAGHPCDAPGTASAPLADPLQTFCQRIDALRDQNPVAEHPVRTAFIFSKAEGPASDTRPIPETLGATEIDPEIPILGICADDAAANGRMAELIAPGAGRAVAYSYRDLPPLELTQIIRATYLPKAYEIPLGDALNSVGDPCNTIRSGGAAEEPTAP